MIVFLIYSKSKFLYPQLLHNKKYYLLKKNYIIKILNKNV